MDDYRSQPIRYLRPLGVAERFNWLIDPLHSSNFAVLLELEGEIDVGRLDAALNEAALRRPTFNVSIRTDPRGVVRFAEASPKPIVTEVRQLQLGENLFGIMADALDKPFPLGAHPLVASDLFISPDGKNHWSMLFHHPIADAKSAARLMLEALGRCEGVGKAPQKGTVSLSPALEDLYPPTLRGARGVPRYFLAFLRFAIDSILTGRPKAPKGFNAEAYAPRKTKLRSLEFDVETTRALAERCKKEKTTIHGALLAAQITALDELDRPEKRKPHGVVTAVDLRDRLNQPVPDERLGYFISLLVKLYRRRKGETFWDLARRSRDKLSVGVERGEAHMLWKVQPPNALLPPNLKGARRLMTLNRFWPPTSFITNIGALRPEVGDGSAQVQTLRFAIGSMPNMILVTAAASIGGRLSLVFSFDETRLPAGVDEKIVERMRTLLVGSAS